MILFNADVTSGLNPTLNVNSTSGAPIQSGGANIVPGTMQAGAWLVLIFDGTNWQYTGPYAPPATLAWVPWQGYSSSSTGMSVNGTANYAVTQSFVVQAPIAFSKFDVRVTTGIGNSCSGSNPSAGACGYLIAVYNAPRTSQLCLSAVAYYGGSPDMNATGPKSISVSTGANVSSGVCYLPPGHYILLQTSDSTALRIQNLQNAGVGFGTLMGQNTAAYWGVSSASVSTGNGNALALASNISSSSFVINDNTAFVGLER
jgi:hypothetical protein